MKINEYFTLLLPEEQELTAEAKMRILDNLQLPAKQGKRGPARPLRIALAAAVFVILLCGAAFAAYKVDWNAAYREFFHIQSDDVQGFVEYSAVEVTEEAGFQPVSCVTGVQTMEVRFSYGPISRETARKLQSVTDTENNCQYTPEEAIMIEVEELPEWGPIYRSVEEYDENTGMALFSFKVWYEDLPEQLTIHVTRVTGDTLEVIGEMGTLVMYPEESDVKIAELNLRTTGPDGREGGIVALKIAAGSYCWVEDIPGMSDWNGDFDGALLDPEFSKYTTDWDNLLLDEFMGGAYLTFQDGSTFLLGGGISITWDGEHYCQWGGGVYDLGNLVSVTINGIEYPFE